MAAIDVVMPSLGDLGEDGLDLGLLGSARVLGDLDEEEGGVEDLVQRFLTTADEPPAAQPAKLPSLGDSLQLGAAAVAGGRAGEGLAPPTLAGGPQHAGTSKGGRLDLAQLAKASQKALQAAAQHNEMAVILFDTPVQPGAWQGCRASPWCNLAASHDGPCNARATIPGVGAYAHLSPGTPPNEDDLHGRDGTNSDAEGAVPGPADSSAACSGRHGSSATHHNQQPEDLEHTSRAAGTGDGAGRTRAAPRPEPDPAAGDGAAARPPPPAPPAKSEDCPDVDMSLPASWLGACAMQLPSLVVATEHCPGDTNILLLEDPADDNGAAGLPDGPPHAVQLHGRASAQSPPVHGLCGPPGGLPATQLADIGSINAAWKAPPPSSLQQHYHRSHQQGLGGGMVRPRKSSPSTASDHLPMPYQPQASFVPAKDRAPCDDWAAGPHHAEHGARGPGGHAHHVSTFHDGLHGPWLPAPLSRPIVRASGSMARVQAPHPHPSRAAGSAGADEAMPGQARRTPRSTRSVPDFRSMAMGYGREQGGEGLQMRSSSVTGMGPPAPPPPPRVIIHRWPTQGSGPPQARRSRAPDDLARASAFAQHHLPPGVALPACVPPVPPAHDMASPISSCPSSASELPQHLSVPAPGVLVTTASPAPDGASEGAKHLGSAAAPSGAGAVAVSAAAAPPASSVGQGGRHGHNLRDRAPHQQVHGGDGAGAVPPLRTSRLPEVPPPQTHGGRKRSASGGIGSTCARPVPHPAGNCCTACGTTVTPVWRAGPQGPKTLCNACGVRYMKVAKRK